MKTPEEEKCPTCGLIFGDPNGAYCSNSFHLMAPSATAHYAVLLQENEKLRAALKELIPIANDRLFSIPVASLKDVEAIIERAKALIEK